MSYQKKANGKNDKQGSDQIFKVIFGQSSPSTNVHLGTTIMAAADLAGVELASDCGGQGTCGKCLVQATPAASLSALTQAEEELLSLEQQALGYRLACQARIKGDLDSVSGPSLGGPQTNGEGKTEIQGVFPSDPQVQRLFLAPEAPPRGEENDLPDLAHWLARRMGRNSVRMDPVALRHLALPHNYGQEATLVEDGERGLIAMLPGRRERSLGLAVDLGTTTVAAYLCDLKSGRVLTAAGETNPQRRFGEDVISRIAHADHNPDGLAQLSSLARETINRLIQDLVAKAGAGPDDLDRVCLVGNTTMQQILAGIHPHALGRAPYLPLTRDPLDLRAADLDLDLNPAVPVHLFPVISAYVGGDALAAVLAEERGREGTTLIVDIGTNGELVLLSPGGAWATSCATGPALEGAHISAGVRAVDGAIHRVEDGPRDQPPVCRLIGEGKEKALGLCGTGLIDAVAVLRKRGIIIPSGRFDDTRKDVEKDEEGVGRAYTLVPAEQTKTGAALKLTLQDIRQVQLAKAALYTGVEMLLEKSGINRVDTTILTGAFGAKFDWRNATAIGLFPKEAVTGRVEAVVNAAGKGAVMALVNKAEQKRALDLAGTIKVVELSQDAGFTLRFTQAINFPQI